ncbi:MAG: hypothetical protein PHS73_04635, partial [Candidatus Peribacteraceae bacterium]|nr:hypothetical protein [Candidatus Peribacteraceae bacterium]
MQIFRIHSRWFPLLSACVALGILLLILLPLPNPASLDDGLRHLAIGRIMAEHGIRAVTGGLDRRDSVTGWGDFFSAGYFTQHNTDPWFLADVLMMPLGSLPTLIALKLISICSIIILIAAMLFSFRTFRLPPFPAGALLLLLLLGEPKFTGRLLLARPFLLMTSMAILMLPAVLRRRHGAVFLLLVFATLFSHLFVLPLGIAALGALWLWSRREKRSALLCLAALLGGTGTGLLLHPTSSDYTHYLLTVFLRIPFAFSSRASMGSEMYTSFASGPSLVEPLAALLLLMGLFAVVRLRIPWERLHRSGLTLIAAIAGPLLLASFVWVRAVDILWPFLILLLAGLVALAPDLPRRMLHAFAPRSPAGTGRILLLVLLLVCSARLYRLTELMTERNAHTALSRFAALSVLPEDATVLNIDW